MIRIIILFSQFENQASIPKRLAEEIAFFENLESIESKIFYINSVEDSSNFLINNQDGGATILFVASGGTEEYAKILIDYIDNPILLIANSKQNSLAASLENEDLYNRIFHNLNQILMKKWERLDDKTKENIKIP